MTTLALFDLSGKIALVTGCNSGIGMGMATALAEAGADILVVGTLLERDPDWEKKFNDIILAIRS